MLHLRGNSRPKGFAAALIASALIAVCSLAAAGSAQAEALPSLTIAATSTAVTVTGAPAAGAVNVITSSTGVKEASIFLFQVKPGVTPAEVFALLATKNVDPNSAAKYGAIVFDNEAPSGTGDEAQTTLAAGEYIAVVAGEKGPIAAHATFTVAPSLTPLALPAAGAIEKTIDFGFKGPSTLKVGELVGFEDAGYLVHMNIAFPVKSMKAAKKVVAGLKSGHERALGKLIAGPPVQFQAPVSPGGYQQTVITARPGIYVQACFMETQDHRVHTRLGMERIIKIVK